jgi:formamidopyrimidine-DNA glycosylase
VPELPEVEALAADLRERVVGHRIQRVDVAAISALKTFDPPPTALSGATVTGAGRFGKFLDIRVGELASQPAKHGGELASQPAKHGGELAGQPAKHGGELASQPAKHGGELASQPTQPSADLHLIVHLARAGWLHYRDALPPAPLKPGKGPIALRVRLEDGSGFDLTEQGTQKRLAAYLVRDPALVPGVGRLGPDALTVDEAAFAARIRSRRGQLKGLITDQEIIAGIGNAYSDEILHRAKLSPFAMSDRLNDEQMATLYTAAQSVLKDAVARSVGQPASSLKGEKRSGLLVHARAGLPCPVCGDIIREVSFADSSLQYCPGCQTGGKPLADRRMSKLLR